MSHLNTIDSEKVTERARVAVTGGLGFIGSHVVEELLAQGRQVIAIDSLDETVYPNDTRRLRAKHFAELGVEVLCADLNELDLDPILSRVDSVVHLAASPGLIPSWTQLEAYTRNNLHASYRLADALARSSVKSLVVASTSSVYGLVATESENATPLPSSPYGITKLAAEHAIRARLADSVTRLCILRLYSVYGSRQRPDMAWHRFLLAIDRGNPITISGDGTQSRTPTHVLDVVAAITQGIDGERAEGLFNVGGQEELTVLEVVQCMSEVIGKEARIEFIPPRRGDQIRTRAVVDRASAILNFRPTMSFREGITEQWEFLKEATKT